MCKRCETKPVIKLISGENLCRTCFLNYFERKVRKTIRVNKLIGKKENLLVAVSGGKDSLSVLDVLHSIYKGNRNVKISALLIDEGIKGYRENCIKATEKYCIEQKLLLNIVSFKEEFGFTLDKIVKGKRPCSVCGVLRRSLLNTKAREFDATKLVTGHNLDDEAQTIIMNQFRRNVDASSRLGPITGNENNEDFVRRIKPFYFMTEKEIMTYAFLKGLTHEFNECPYNVDSYRHQIREMLNKFEELYPGTKNSIVSSFMEILPLLKKHENKIKIKKCKKCSEPSSSEICQKCKILYEIASAKH
jgi:uncharacterized protein (TIGR00269 family)